MLGTAQRAPLPTLSRAKPLLEGLDIDEAASMAAFADPAVAVEGLHRKADDAALHRDHPRGGADGGADGDGEID